MILEWKAETSFSGWVDSDFASDMEAAGRKGTRPSEKAKMPEEALLTRSSKATKPMNACVHTYTKSQTPFWVLRVTLLPRITITEY